MGTITGTEIADRARRVLQDTASGGTRWLDAEILDWINEAQRAIVLVKPNAKSTVADVTMVAGAKQSLPTGGIQLLSITRNANGPAITRVDRRIMDAENRSWYTATASNTALHYIFDEDAPDTFYLYPPQTGTPGDIEMNYSVAPTDLGSLASTIDLNDIYDAPILDYVLYRAYMKDTDYSGNLERATTHYQAFVGAVTGKASAELQGSPNADLAIARGN